MFNLASEEQNWLPDIKRCAKCDTYLCQPGNHVHTLSLSSLRIRIRKSFIVKCVCTHKEFVFVLGASSTESTNIVQTTYN